MFQYTLYRIVRFLVNVLPLKLAYALAVFISDLQYYISHCDREAVTNNLKAILPDEPHLRPLVKNVFRNFGKYLVDFLRVEKNLTRGYIKNHIRISGEEHISRVRREGRGGIILTAHLGNWELGAAVISMLGYPLVAVALEHQNNKVNELFNHQREVKGITVIPPGAAVKKGYEALKQNKFLAIVGDRDFGGNGIKLNFFGRPTMIPKGAAIFAQKANTPIIPTFLTRNEDGTFHLTFEKMIYPEHYADEQDEKIAMLSIMKDYVSLIEAKIRAYPDQWLIYREFWIQ